MSIDPVEIHSPPFPSSTLEREDPEPTYKDELITVYAIPVVRSSPTNAETFSSEPSTKRKRSPSFHSPSKRSVVGHPQDSITVLENELPLPEMASTPSVATPIQELLRRPNFSPKYLTGKRADEWRRAIIETMFTGEKTPDAKGKQTDLVMDDEKGSRKAEEGVTEKSMKHKGHGKGRGVKGSGQRRCISTELINGGETTDAFIEASSPLKAEQVRVPAPYGFNKQLPPFPSSSYKPTLAYVIIGPRRRGKFDAAKAQELGLPKGYLRAELTRGKTVSFKVSDGHSGMVERIVRPEDVIGESETPGVRFPQPRR
jgi:ribonuclease Z